MDLSARWVVVLGLAASLVAHAGWTTRKVRLKNRLVIPPHSERLLSVTDLRISAPAQGHNVCEFADNWSSFQTVGSSGGGGLRVSTVIGTGPYKRATFNYLLAEDSAPLFKDALQQSGVAIDSSSALAAETRVVFAYFFPDPDRAGPSSTKNELAIRMDLELVVSERDRVVAKRAYVGAAVEEFSTGWVTFPREGTLNSLYNKALSSILSQIASDSELQAGVKAR